MFVPFLVFLGTCIVTAFMVVYGKMDNKFVPKWVKTLAKKWQYSATQAKARAEAQDALDRQYARKPVCLTDEEDVSQ